MEKNRLLEKNAFGALYQKNLSEEEVMYIMDEIEAAQKDAVNFYVRKKAVGSCVSFLAGYSKTTQQHLDKIAKLFMISLLKHSKAIQRLGDNIDKYDKFIRYLSDKDILVKTRFNPAKYPEIFEKVYPELKDEPEYYSIDADVSEGVKKAIICDAKCVGSDFNRESLLAIMTPEEIVAEGLIWELATENISVEMFEAMDSKAKDKFVKTKCLNQTVQRYLQLSETRREFLGIYAKNQRLDIDVETIELLMPRNKSIRVIGVGYALDRLDPSNRHLVLRNEALLNDILKQDHEVVFEYAKIARSKKFYAK